MLNILPKFDEDGEDNGYSEEDEDNSLEIASDILSKTSIIKATNKVESVREIFEAEGAGVREAAATIADVMKNSKSGGVKLRGAELALKAQQVFNEIDEKKIPQININIVGDGTKSIINLVLPNG